MDGDAGAQGVARLVQGRGIGGRHAEGQIAFSGQAQHQRPERRIDGGVGQHLAKGGGEPFLADLVRLAARPRQDQAARQALAGFPAVEQVGIGGQ